MDNHIENQKRRKKSQIKSKNEAKKKYIVILAALIIVVIAAVCIIVLTSKSNKSNEDNDTQPPVAISTEGSSESSDDNGQSESIEKVKPKPVDKTNLENLIHNASEINVSSYTQASVDALNTAMAEGNAVLDDETAERTKIENACKKLLDAIQGLKKQ